MGGICKSQQCTKPAAGTNNPKAKGLLKQEMRTGPSAALTYMYGTRGVRGVSHAADYTPIRSAALRRR